MFQLTAMPSPQAATRPRLYVREAAGLAFMRI
jgi:hypothetical protein